MISKAASEKIDIPGPVVIKLFFMLNLTEREISTARKTKLLSDKKSFLFKVSRMYLSCQQIIKCQQLLAF